MQHQEDVEDRVREIRSQAIAVRSRRIYQHSSAQFLAWLCQNKVELLSDRFCECIAIQSATANDIRKTFLESADKTPPIKFSELTAHVFFEWMLSLRKADGSTLGHSTYSSHRAALFNLFRDYGEQMPQHLSDELSILFKGLKREIVSRIASGDGRVKTGKDAMDFSLYRYLGKAFLKTAKSECCFGHCFMILCWNLMCRAGNLVSVCYSHMEWKNDALGIYFAHMKNDQYGERPREPRHIYANPLMPEICPILALGLYMLCVPFEGQGNMKLFPGGNQYDRFRRLLIRVLESEDGLKELANRGMTTDDIGTHSMRKGSATFASSGSTACPSSSAIHLRAGWTLGGVQDTYLRYEGAGDMHVGRTVSGLPLDSPEFAILPPMFVSQSEDLTNMIEACLPHLPLGLTMVAEFGIASIIYHAQFLRDTLPTEHRIFATPLFREKDVFQRLSTLVVCRLGQPADRIQATGIPPHVSILVSVHKITTSLHHVCDDLRRIPPDVVSLVIKELEDRAIGCGTVTRDGLENLINQCLEKAGVQDLVRHVQNPQQQQCNNISDTSPSRPIGFGSYMWGGALHLVPESFRFPDGDVLLAWQYWCCGNPAHGYPPLRLLKPSDMATKNLRKRLCDFQFLMHQLEGKLTEADSSIFQTVPLSIQQANNMFQYASTVLHVNQFTVNGSRKRRASQVKWRTMVNILQKKK